MAIVRVGLTTDPHVAQLGTGQLNAVLDEMERSDFPDSNHVPPKTQGSISLCYIPGDITAGGSTVANYRSAHSCIVNRPYTVRCTAGNHDEYKRTRFVKWLDDLNSVETISGLRFITIDSTPKNLFGAEYHLYGMCDKAVLDWLKAELDGSPSTPTFISLHHPLHEFSITVDSTQYRYTKDTTVYWGAGGVGHEMLYQKYYILSNNMELRGLLEDASYEVVAVFAGHLNGLQEYMNFATGGVEYFNLKNPSGASADFFYWLYLDTTTPNNSMVYERIPSTHLDTEVKGLDW